MKPSPSRNRRLLVLLVSGALVIAAALSFRDELQKVAIVARQVVDEYLHYSIEDARVLTREINRLSYRP